MRVRGIWHFGVAITLIAMAFIGCRGEGRTTSREARESESAAARPAATKTTAFAVQGMTCTGCEIGVIRVLERVPGVVSAGADYGTGKAWAEYDPERVQVRQLVEAIETLGYSARPLEQSG